MYIDTAIRNYTMNGLICLIQFICLKLTVTNLFYELLTLSYLPNVSDGVGETVREIEKPG